MDLKRSLIDLMPGPLVRTFASPYIAGKGVASGVAKADALQERGLCSTIDLLGEEVFDRADVEATVQVYFRMFEAMQDRRFATVSLKPTQLGINESVEYCQDNLKRIAAAAAARGLRITLDMEDSSFTDRTLQMFKAVRDEFDNFGIVLQSRLFRTAEDIRTLHAGSEGILRAFQKIGATGQASIQTVGPDIAHALVATAVGLLAAIPAVMAYNYFNTRIKEIHGEIDAFSSDFLNIVKRHYRGR